MIRICALLLTLLLISLGTLARADPPARVARLNYAAGAVSFAPAQAPEAWTQAVLNRPLTDGDRLWAGDTGRAELHIGSMAIRLGALSSVDVLHLDDDTVHLRLAQGAINLRVRDLGPDETIEIATSTGVVLVRQPGSYSISSEPQSDVARVLVNFGQAQVVTPAQTVTVPTGQAAMISSRAGIAFELAGHNSADEFDRWSAERDRREDHVISARYVSRNMTGYEDLDAHGSWRTLPEYGAVWVPTRVAPGWAPYRYGHWSWIAPWGWTWIDDAPWGFAPSHYGRWVWLDSYWAWAPGRLERRPVYAPALVAFVGGSNFSLLISSGPAVGWFPLGWREPYRPWYRASENHVRRVNVSQATNYQTMVNPYVHGNRRDAVTVVTQQTFVAARPVAASRLNVSQAQLARAEVLRDRQPAQPEPASFAAERAAQRPPTRAAARDVFTNPSAAPAAREAPSSRERSSFPQDGEAEPRGRSLRDRDSVRSAPSAATPTAPSVSQPRSAAPAAATPAVITPPPVPSAVMGAPARPAVAPRTVEAGAARAAADAERRGARRDAGTRDDGPSGRRERAGDRMAAPRTQSAVPPAPAVAAQAAAAAPQTQPPREAERRDDRSSRERSGGARPPREGGRQRSQNDG